MQSLQNPSRLSSLGLCETERKMLLDFCGLETGKVRAGAAMWACLETLKERGLMTTAMHSEPTVLGREVANEILAERKAQGVEC